MFNIIACVDKQWGIGKNGTIPWHDTVEARGDLAWFREKTLNSVVIMGYRTFQTLPKPLSRRITLVVGCNQEENSARTHTLAQEFEEKLDIAIQHDRPIWVIGGAQIYAIALSHPKLHACFINHLNGDYQCDTIFPHNIPSQLSPSDARHPHFGNNPTTATIHMHANTSELAYLYLVGQLLNAPLRPNRTGIHTRGMFAQSLRFPLRRDNTPILPLITTKKTFLRGITTELLWFLHGDTDLTYLHKHKCRIWDANASKEFLATRNLPYPEGTLGPVYGWQWRRFNTEYRTDAPAHPASDQIAILIKNLQTDPWGRRHLVSAWNPQQLDQMALPPCHYAFQLHTEHNSNHTMLLNISVQMRSADVGLGVPFNIASYALLGHIIAQLASTEDLEFIPNELVLNMADCHIYTTHEEALREQIQRFPRDFPSVKIRTGSIDELYEIGPDCVTISDYDPHPAIRMEMAI